MKILICFLLVVALSGCIPIGIQANTRALNASDSVGAAGGDAASSRALY
jgi:hypothetical protein